MSAEEDARRLDEERRQRAKDYTTRLEEERQRRYNGGPPPHDDDDEPLVVFEPTTLWGKEVPIREWVVEDWIPKGVVTGLYGNGGIGKSLLLMQLQTGLALGTSWLGLPTQRMRSVGLYCEDHLDELHRRQHDINKLYDCGHFQLGDMGWLARFGYDNSMTDFINGRGLHTPLVGKIIAACREREAKLFIADTVSDVFNGNENDRGQTRQFVQATLGYIAREIGDPGSPGTVIASAHPSRAGIATGTGDSGSTAWSNTFRSRLSLEMPETDKHTPPDDYARQLSRKKANYAGPNEIIDIRWNAGAFVTKGGSDGKPTDRPAAVDVFLTLLDRLTKQGRHVSPNNRAGNYAPKEFVRQPPHYGYRVEDFERAMNGLFEQGVIRVGQIGRASKMTAVIERCPAGGAAGV